MSQATELYRETLPECADSIESHPSVSGLFALSTYQVDQEEIDREMGGRGGDGDQEQSTNEDAPATTSSRHSASEDVEDAPATTSSPPYTRKGQVRLYSYDSTSQSCNLTWSSPSMAAVLDTKWTGDGRTLGVADATGCVSLFHRTGSGLELSSVFRMNTKKALCLSLDFSDRVKQAADQRLVVSQSDGTLAVLPSVSAAVRGDEEQARGVWGDLRGGEESEEEDDDEDDEDEGENDGDTQQKTTTIPPLPTPPGLETWQAHSHEAWTTSFDPHSAGQIIWSGGDDLALKGWDLRTSRRQPTSTHTRSFNGGVTSMEAHHTREGFWAVGSYDGQLRFFDSRNTMRPVQELELPGGIWRVKWHDDGERVLAACMHGGFCVVRVGEGSTQVVSELSGHDSLAYGCDWDRGWSSGNVYSCSFYDRRLCAWRVGGEKV